MAKFKTRARALDLLGRQQIAGVPTAINELFKNAHDAYADHVEVDYFRKERTLVLRDDGLGMTKDDVELRWLTLGTESKFTNHKIPPPPSDPNKSVRPIMGEKGIGRLSIASIGSQVLIITRAKRKNQLGKIVAAFINWKLFEVPGLNLDDVVVPVREYSDGKLPDTSDVADMKSELVSSIEKLVKSKDVLPNVGKKLITEINSFKISPSKMEKKLPGLLQLTKDSGTHFYISHVEETLNQDIDGDREDKDATKVQKMLVGFTNTMTPNHPTPQIEAVFRDYRNDDGTYFSIIDKDQFFTQEDFALADHHFEGKFDEFGQFNGTIKVYNEKEFEHKINWSGNNFRETECGPFTINIAYLQGALRQSTMNPDHHARLLAKADKYGGIYIYKDNLRILPYGNSDYDFVDIEKNRTKSASYYFFSYRRMYGVIDIAKETNPNLKEKAGREGFIENKAYRQVRDILKNFFVQLAADFFREGGGPKSEFWLNRRSEQEHIHKAKETRDKQAKARKDSFQTGLNSFFEKLAAGQYQDEVSEFLDKTDKSFGSVAYINDPDEASQCLIDNEAKARQKLDEIRARLKINQPRGFSISKEVKQDWESYLQEYEKLGAEVFSPAEEKIEELIRDYTNRLQIEISKRKRLEQAVNAISDEAKKTATLKGKETREAVASISTKVKNLTHELMSGLEDRIRDVKDRFKHLQIDEAKDFDLVEERKKMENEIVSEKERSTEILESVIRQLSLVQWNKDANGNLITSDQISDSLEEELSELREKVHADVELSQLGLAVGVIHHEFNSTVGSIRSSIKELKAWADVNQQLTGVYDNIRVNFEHLDGYLTLFTPLNRRLYRQAEDIPANDINAFLLDLFKARFVRHNIQLKHTKGFSARSLHGYRSTFYPVFVNIVDNAIYWLKQKPDSGERVIRLHADDSGFYISNNGPEISIQDKTRIFELGFTRKSNGRGMGLHISKEVLEGNKYHILLDSPRPDGNVTFKIEPLSNE